jgi:hypothetical protein
MPRPLQPPFTVNCSVDPLKRTDKLFSYHVFALCQSFQVFLPYVLIMKLFFAVCTLHRLYLLAQLHLAEEAAMQRKSCIKSHKNIEPSIPCYGDIKARHYYAIGDVYEMIITSRVFRK